MVDQNNEKLDKNMILETKFLHSLMKGVRNVFLLWLLSKKKMHGYAIISAINDMYCFMGDEVVHGSTIYPLLHSLEKEGLIISSEGYNGNHKVKMYKITEKGIFTLNSIKKFIKDRPSDDILLTYLDEMIFNDELFVYEGSE